jgi:hypothetical protein
LEYQFMTRLNLLAGAFMILGTVAAHAQSPAPDASAAPPPGGADGGAMHGSMGGHGGYMGMHRRAMMMQKSAGFRFKRDGAEIDIRCAADESTKACVDAAAVLIDKLATIKTTP